MDKLRGIWIPAILALMGAVLMYLGNAAEREAVALASMEAAAKPQEGALAPMAEAEARRRAINKRAYEVHQEGLAFTLIGLLMIATAGGLGFSHLRAFRPMATGMSSGPSHNRS